MLWFITVLLLPFLGTVLGAAGVCFPGIKEKPQMERFLSAFAAGVMVAASIWSLILPAISQSERLGSWQFIPALTGIWAGFLALLLLDHWVPHLHQNSAFPEGKRIALEKNTMLVLAVSLHNLPEGMAVGVAAAGWLMGNGAVSFAAFTSLSLGIALQNIPEGAIISMPLKSTGMKNRRAFFYGVLSGIIEPIGAFATLLFASLVIQALPYFLCFAAGAMLYVVVEALIPEAVQGDHSDRSVMAFFLGFTLMMTLDVALG